MDRIEHTGIEDFKQRVYNTLYHGLTIGQWNRLLSKGKPHEVSAALEKHIGIRRVQG